MLCLDHHDLLTITLGNRGGNGISKPQDRVPESEFLRARPGISSPFSLGFQCRLKFVI